MKKIGYILKNKDGRILTFVDGDDDGTYWTLKETNKIGDNILFSSIITKGYYNTLKYDIINDDDSLEKIHINDLILCEVTLDIKL